MDGLDWDDLVRADPRIAALDSAAQVAAIVHVAFREDQSTHDIYSEVKPYIDVLVGWRRGYPVNPHTRRPDITERFAEVVAQPPPAVNLAFLHESEAYRLACEHIFDSICDAVDRNTGSIA